KRLTGILICVLLANVLNYALGTWLDRQVVEWAAPVPAADGSTLNTSRFFVDRGDTVLAGRPDQEALLDFYTYLDGGGSANYLTWRNARRELRGVGTPFLQRAITVADNTNTGKYLSLLLLILVILLLYGKAFRETSWLTPLLHLLIVTGATILYGSLSAWLFTGVVIGTWIIYFGGLKLFLPLYFTEWNRSMRPGLTLCLFLLATMAWRGPELVDYWFWTSPLFRLGLVLVLLLSLFFHYSILTTVLKQAKTDRLTSIFSYCIVLGLSLLLPSLFLGFYGDAAGTAVQQLNYELLTFAPATAAGFPENVPFVLSLVGIVLFILAGIGYNIQRIAK
ncbi:MAG: hypothetical protein AAFN92_07900, partial [Bacteroidota bacterium]